jgi:hypothetical protein
MFKIMRKESIEDSEDYLSKLLINNFYEIFYLQVILKKNYYLKLKNMNL